MKNIFARSHTEHPWRCSKDFDLDFPLTKTKSEKKTCILKVLQGFSLFVFKSTYLPMWKFHQLNRSFTICMQTFHHSKDKRPFCTFKQACTHQHTCWLFCPLDGKFFHPVSDFFGTDPLFLFFFFLFFFSSSDLTYLVISKYYIPFSLYLPTSPCLYTIFTSPPPSYPSTP